MFRYKVKRILSQPDHVLSTEFALKPSGRRYYDAPLKKTNCYSDSFIPSAIKLLNVQCQELLLVVVGWMNGCICTRVYACVHTLSCFTNSLNVVMLLCHCYEGSHLFIYYFDFMAGNCKDELPIVE